MERSATSPPPLDTALLDACWPPALPRLASRGVLVRSLPVAAFVLGAAATALLLPPLRPWSPLAALAALAAVLAYAAVSRVRFHAGAGFAVPTQVVFVPMLFLVPIPAVAPLVAAGLVLGTLPHVLARRVSPARLSTTVVDASHALGPAVVFGLAGCVEPRLEDWPVYLLAFGAQVVVGLLVSVGRERLSLGAPVLDLVRAMLGIAAADLLLGSVGLLAALADTRDPFAWALVLPLVVLFALIARDRSARIAEGQERLAALRRERLRFDAAVKRIGEAVAANLDRDALVAITLRTAVDAVQATGGRAALLAPGARVAAIGDLSGAEVLLGAAEVAALAAGGPAGHDDVAQDGPRFALACPVTAGTRARPVAVLSLVRREGAFAAEERDALAYLAAQAAVSVENVDLHERLRDQALTDGLTGLPNHRCFQERLDAEIVRARRAGDSLALLLLDMDGFKAVNDIHGHQAGDLVLRHVAAALAACCRPGEEPARYGGEEFAVLAPGAGPEAARALAESVRAAIRDTVIELPGGVRLASTVSVGVALGVGTGLARETLLTAADQALYAAKGAGKDRVVTAGAADLRPRPPGALAAGRQRSMLTRP